MNSYYAQEFLAHLKHEQLLAEAAHERRILQIMRNQPHPPSALMRLVRDGIDRLFAVHAAPVEQACLEQN